MSFLGKLQGPKEGCWDFAGIEQSVDLRIGVFFSRGGGGVGLRCLDEFLAPKAAFQGIPFYQLCY